MLGSAASVSHRNESFNSILPGDVLSDKNGSRTIFNGDLRFRDFNRTDTSADLMGQIVRHCLKVENEFRGECDT